MSTDEPGRGRTRVSSRVPTSTYRIQLRTPASDPAGRGLVFSDVVDLLPYLADLGVGAVYLSPVLEAVAGSTHGYDVVDPTRVSAELGGLDGLRALRSACHEHGLGLVVDIVPNHVGVDDAAQNRWWWDVLRLGSDSEYFAYFDIDDTADNGSGGRIAIPVLGSPDDVDALVLEEAGGPDDDPVLRYHDKRFPVAPGTLGGSGAGADTAGGSGTDTAGVTAADVHARQHYRLVHWREPLLGYRRFFTVTGLAGLRQEDERVFTNSHSAVAQWCAEDLVDGIRVDHPDGLTDPVGYGRRLRELVGDDRWLVFEKILAPDEVFEPAQRIDGTTGYDLLRVVDQLLVDPHGESRLLEIALRYTGRFENESEVRAESGRLKGQIVESDLAPELARLVRSARREAASEGTSSVVDAEVTSADGASSVSDADLAAAGVVMISSTPYYRADYPVLRGTLPRLLAEAMHDRPELRPALRQLGRALAPGGETSARLVQVTGAATAKAEEDRLFYRLAKLVSLNEVGGSPGRMGLDVEEFHLHMAERARVTPLAMSALSTHDTKRGEDVRARISVLSQIPDEWERFATEVFAVAPPPAEDAGYFLLQVVVGVWQVSADGPVGDGPVGDGPVGAEVRDRLQAYAIKATREAAMHTTWTGIDAEFEDRVRAWIDGLCGAQAGLVSEFVARIAGPGRDNSLVAKAVQLLSPGVPDVYQGTEVWEDSLVDPDNRRFVDYSRLRSGAVVAAGHPKFLLVREALQLRRAHPETMARGAHVPMSVAGPGTSDVIAFTRDLDGRAVLGIIARRRTVTVLPEDLGDTVVTLPEGTWATGPGAGGGAGAGGGVIEVAGAVSVGDLLRAQPVVVISRRQN